MNEISRHHDVYTIIWTRYLPVPLLLILTIVFENLTELIDFKARNRCWKVLKDSEREILHILHRVSSLSPGSVHRKLPPKRQVCGYTSLTEALANARFRTVTAKVFHDYLEN